MEMPENLINYIREEAKRVHHGRITVELNDTSNKIDVVTESRERFEREAQKERKTGEKQFRKG